MKKTVLSKMTRASFCEDVKCKTHHLPTCPTYLTCPALPPPFGSCSSLSPLCQPGASYNPGSGNDGAPCEVEKSVVTSVIGNGMQRMQEELRKRKKVYNLSVNCLKAIILVSQILASEENEGK